MLVQLTDNVRIECADCNFTLQRKQVRKQGAKAGEEHYVAEGYYASLCDAAVGAIRKELLHGDAELEVRGLVEFLQQLGAQVARSCQLAPGKVKRVVLPADAPALEAMMERAAQGSARI